MSSYWANDDKIKVSQTQVSISSTNGQSYSGTAGQSGRRVDFEIPPTVKFLDGKNSYLQFDLKLAVPAGEAPTRLHLDPFIGGQSCIKNIRIYSGNRAVLLEEITEYNAKVQIQYSYNQDESMRKMRALKEGSLVTTIENRGTLGTSVSNNIDLDTNPYYKPVGTVPAARDWGTADDFLTAKLSLPIHCGMFADGGDSVFPCLLSHGLFIEVDMEDPARFIKQLDSVNRHRRMKQNPVFHGIDAAGAPLTIANATNRTEIFLAKSNNMRSVSNCPFVKGERIGLCDATNPNRQCNLTLTSSGAVGYPVITDITIDATYVKLTLEEFQNSDGGTGLEATSNNLIVFSASIDQKRLAIAAPNAELIPAKTSYAATCEFSNFEIICSQVSVDPRYEAGMMKKMRDGGSIEIDIPSVTNYKHSLLSSNRNATVNLAVSNTRVKSMICMPSDANVMNSADLIGGTDSTYLEEEEGMDGVLHSIRSGQVGIIDELTSYQMVVDDKLVPSRPIVVSKINKGTSIAAQPLIELEKALKQSGIVPRSFVDYNRNFLIGRAYALNDGVANLNNKSNQLQLLYNETSVAGVDRPPTRNKLLYVFMFHLRRISIKGDAVTVTL
tara:strand:- start:5471 stop:7303 length:1833 start_codon:yes stop_codon:yes gene_type:complete